MSLSSRTTHLIKSLTILGYEQSLKALELVIKDMSADKGYARHDGSHYYHHLVDVAQMLLNFKIRDEDTITAALLHDYLEDVSGATPKLLELLFNKRVADIVELLTKIPGIDYREPGYMQDYLYKISTDVSAALIKTADRMHNFSSMREDTSLVHKARQLKETELFYIPFFKKCRNMYPRYEAFFFQAKTTIEPMMYYLREIMRLSVVETL